MCSVASFAVLRIFHALQAAHKHIKDAFGPDYADQQPAAEQLKQDIDRIFAAEALTLATERYTAVLARRQAGCPSPARGCRHL